MATIKFADPKEGGIAGSVDFDAGTFTFTKNAMAYMGRGHRVTLPVSILQLSGTTEKEQRANFKKKYDGHFEIEE